MPDIRVLVEMRHSNRLASSADLFRRTRAAYARTEHAERAPKMSKEAVPSIKDFGLDDVFGALQLPGRKETERMGTRDLSVGYRPAMRAQDSTYLVRGTVAEKKLSAFEKECQEDEQIVGVYSDPAIRPVAAFPSGPVGTDTTVESRLCTDVLNEKGMNGTGVLVAIVDTGVNMAWLNSKGKHPSFDAARSWAPYPGLIPGSMPVDHGTMCAFDACIAAPNCTILDIALLQSTTPGVTPMDGFLSDAVLAFRHLLDIMDVEGTPPSLVVNNSWGMYHPSWDFDVGHPGNFSDNPNHPFNRIVGTLESAGADIVFAAGNCGEECPDSRCQGFVDRPIYGANSHPQVLCVSAATVDKERLCYSSQGPGRLAERKPDVTGYSHFRGSGVYPADGGTSAAAPVVAGVVAAVRSVRPYTETDPDAQPAAIRELVRTTAEDLGPSGYDFDHGFGIIDACAIAERVVPSDTPDEEEQEDDDTDFWDWFCRNFPWWCWGTNTPTTNPSEAMGVASDGRQVPYALALTAAQRWWNRQRSRHANNKGCDCE